MSKAALFDMLVHFPRAAGSKPPELAPVVVVVEEEQQV